MHAEGVWVPIQLSPIQLKTMFNSMVERQRMSIPSPTGGWCYMMHPQCAGNLNRVSGCSAQSGLRTWIDRLLYKHEKLLIFIKHTFERVNDLNELNLTNLNCV